MVTELSAKLSQWKLSFYVLDPMGRSSHTHCTNKTIGWANIYFRRYSWLSNYHLGRWWRQWPFLAARDNSPSRVWCTGELKDKFHWFHYFHWVSHFHLFFTGIFTSSTYTIRLFLLYIWGSLGERTCHSIDPSTNLILFVFRQHYEFWLVAHTEVGRGKPKTKTI